MEFHETVSAPEHNPELIGYIFETEDGRFRFIALDMSVNEAVYITTVGTYDEAFELARQFTTSEVN